LMIPVLLLSFIWGFFVHRDHIFPYSILQLIAPVSADENSVRKVIQSTSTRQGLLHSLPYVAGTVDKKYKKSGVLQYEKGQAFEGYNFFHSGLKPLAKLVDMNGITIHEWALPGHEWHHVELLPNGDIIVVAYENSLMRLNRDSQLIWRHDGLFHHNAHVTDNGQIYAIVRKEIQVDEIHPTNAIYDDIILEFSMDGEMTAEFSILEVVSDSQYEFLLPSVQDLPFPDTKNGAHEVLDIIHTNHIEVFDGSLAAMSDLFRKGNMLISMRNLNAIAILDGSTRKIIWLWGPTNLVFQHQPVLLNNGHILVFNNGVKKSSIIEMNPMANSIVWRYAPDEGFFSITRGSNQKLPNGNVLITESNTGHVFEVTESKDRVWHYANPDFTEDGERVFIWRMTRFVPEELDFLGQT